MNAVILIGNICNDLELKKTQSGQSVLKFRLAVKRNFKNAQGEILSDFINCIAWRTTADTMSRYLHKGSKIGVTGRIQTGSYDDQTTGKRVYTTDIVVDNFEFLETRNSQSDNQQSHQFEQAQPNSFNDEFSTDNTLDIASDDLPF